MYKVCMNTIVWHNGVRYSNFSILCECSTESEAKSALLDYERIYCGYPVEIWIDREE